jgi:hypothetical protein
MTDPAQDNPRQHGHANVRRSYMALAFVAVVVVVGVLLARSFREHNRTIECLEAGHHDCVPLDTTERGAPR